MNKQDQWLFEIPSASEAAYYANPSVDQEYDRYPKWEAEWELTEAFPLNEAEWETVGRLKVPRRSGIKRPVSVQVPRPGMQRSPAGQPPRRGITTSGSRPTPQRVQKPRAVPQRPEPMQRTVYGWGQYRRRVEELPPNQKAVLTQVGNEIVTSHQSRQPVQAVQICGHADLDTPPNPQRERQMSEERAQQVTKWLKNYVGGNIAAQITWQTRGFGATKLKVQSPKTEADRSQNRRVEIFLTMPSGEESPTVKIDVAPNSLTDSTDQSSEFESSIRTGVNIQPSSIVVPIGQEIEVIATGNPSKPGFPAYTWSIDNLAIATWAFAQGNNSQTHPNRVKLTGKSVGMATLSVTYKDQSNKTAIAQRKIIVTKVEAVELDDPLGHPVMPPETNELVRPQLLRLGGVAHRTIKVKFEPVTFWAGKEAQWIFTPIGRVRGVLPGNHSNNLETEEGFNFTPATQRSIINPDGTTAVRVNLPPTSFNRGQVEIVAINSPSIRTALLFEVPGIVVLDPGHGGNQDLPGSSRNNATSASGILEKTMTLDVAKRIQKALRRNQVGKVHVLMTREDDVNLEGATRARIAGCNGADIFLSIHFNGNSNPTIRGTETFVRAQQNRNVNRNEDLALARRINNAVIAVIPNSQDRGVKDDTQTRPRSLAVLSDESLGNTVRFHPTRSCLVEIEFITNPVVDQLFNISPNRVAFRQQVANAISNAIVEDLQSQP